MVADLYLIFNTGNPQSLIRPLVRDPGWDFLVTLTVSIIIMAIASFVFNPARGARDQIQLLLEANKGYIEKLRSKGRSDEEITESLLNELKLKGLSRKIVRSKVLKQLARLV
jgi:hypothetical protein